MIVNTLWGEEEIFNTRICIYCKEEKSFSEYSVKPDRKDKLDTRCKSCMRKQGRLRSKLKKYSPPKPDVCECCGKVPRYWVIDHDHETDKFRGHVCKSCNNAIGLLGDNLKGVMKAVKYLEKQDLEL